MDPMEFSFWLSKKMKEMKVPGSAKVKMIDLNFSDIDIDQVIVDYDKENNTVEIYEGRAR